MSRPTRRLATVAGACVLLGWSGLCASWIHPDSDLPPALATAAGWPWLLAFAQGALVWVRGRGSSADPHEHFLAVYAAGTALAILVGTLVAAAAGWALPLSGLPPPLAGLGTVLACMALAAFLAGLSLGFVFPALLPPACAAWSARWLAGRPPSPLHLALATSATAVAWLAAALTGLVLAQA